MIEHSCKHAEMKWSLERLQEGTLSYIHPDFLPGGAAQFGKLLHELGELRKAIYRDLSEKLFVIIAEPQSQYFDQDELFGSDVATRFPEANKEIKEAGNCYAAGNNTACVFHLMRAVEHGARALVRGLKIKRGKGKDELPYPVELCDWGTIYGALNEAASKVPGRKSVGASDTRSFYRHAVAQFGNFNDAWRKKVAHTRASYDPYQAMSVIVNTRQFMQHIATRLREKKTR